MKVRDVLNEIDRMEQIAKDLKNNINEVITERTTVHDVIDVFLDYREMLLDQKVERMK